MFTENANTWSVFVGVLLRPSEQNLNECAIFHRLRICINGRYEWIPFFEDEQQTSIFSREVQTLSYRLLRWDLPRAWTPLMRPWSPGSWGSLRSPCACEWYQTHSQWMHWTIYQSSEEVYNWWTKRTWQIDFQRRSVSWNTLSNDWK